MSISSGNGSVAGPAITTTDASAGIFSSRTRLELLHLVTVLCQSALRNLLTCTISAVDGLLAVTLDKIDIFSSPLTSFIRAFVTSSSVGGALLLDAFDFVVPRLQDDGAELLLADASSGW